MDNNAIDSEKVRLRKLEMGELSKNFLSHIFYPQDNSQQCKKPDNGSERDILNQSTIHNLIIGTGKTQMFDLDFLANRRIQIDIGELFKVCREIGNVSTENILRDFGTVEKNDEGGDYINFSKFCRLVYSLTLQSEYEALTMIKRELGSDIKKLGYKLAKFSGLGDGGNLRRFIKYR